MEVALAEGNDSALEWANDYFEERCNSSDLCVFRDWYCALDFDDDEAAEDYFDIDFFEDLLDDILDDHRPNSGAPGWWTPGLEADELESWQDGENDVCDEVGG